MPKMVGHKGDKNSQSRGIAVPGLYGVRYFGKPVPIRRNSSHNGPVKILKPKDPDWKAKLQKEDK